jgi:glycosyltransferase involved in cell wall biosynthesis
MRLIGVTADRNACPVKQWSRCKIGGRGYDFYPILAVDDLRRQMTIPLSLKFTLSLIGSSAWKGSHVIQFHRLEPAVLFHWNDTPKVTVIHQNMKVINEQSSDIRWKYLPGAYFLLEDRVLPRFSEIRIVREDAVVDYRKRFPQQSGHIHFLPTWMNPDLFYVPDTQWRRETRGSIVAKRGWPDDSLILVFVGRLDHQKDPLLSLEVIKSAIDKHPQIRFLMIGDGVLRAEVESAIDALGLQKQVHLFGAMEQHKVAEILRSSDLMLLTSAYEGMPRCVVESLGCGVPVVSTDVGEVGLLIKPGTNGQIAESREAKDLVAAVDDCVKNLEAYSGSPCARSVERFSAGLVLGDLYGCYRKHAGLM